MLTADFLKVCRNQTPGIFLTFWFLERVKFFHKLSIGDFAI